MIYIASMVLFILGSVLCAQAQTMEQLIVFRAVQGIGAGGVLPLAFTIIGQLFSLEQRARMQGLFSGVWGVSAVIGPLIGGFLVDQVSWHWVFLINVYSRADGDGAGLVCLEGNPVHPGQRRSRWITWARCCSPWACWPCCWAGVAARSPGLGSAGCRPGSLCWPGCSVERRAADPILPLHLFRDRLFTVALICTGFFSGWAVFGSLNYVPLFVQAVLGTSATQAGITLTPMSIDLDPGQHLRRLAAAARWATEPWP